MKKATKAKASVDSKARPPPPKLLPPSPRRQRQPSRQPSPPKSLDRNDFTLEPASRLGLSDGARTLAAVTAAAILKSAEHFPARPGLWMVCGGGRKNPHIIGDLRAGASKLGAEVVVAEDVGLDGDKTEAEAWAYLAARSVKGLPLSFPATTGCRRPVTGGVLARP